MSLKETSGIFIHEKQTSSISEVTENLALLYLPLHFESLQRI